MCFKSSLRAVLYAWACKHVASTQAATVHVRATGMCVRINDLGIVCFASKDELNLFKVNACVSFKTLLGLTLKRLHQIIQLLIAQNSLI